jgi:hypothetical protein
MLSGQRLYFQHNGKLQIHFTPSQPERKRSAATIRRFD